jgi:hypothetical protein
MIQASTRSHRNHTSADHQFIQRLMKDPTITIKPADKNLGMAMVDTTWYENELTTMLGDQTTYKHWQEKVAKVRRGNTNGVLTTDRFVTTDELKKRIYLTLKEIIEKHKFTIEHQLVPHHHQITHFLRHKITDHTASFPEIYLLIKVHKTNLCGRPIVPTTRWLTSAASVLADHLLQEIFKRANINWIVKDTKSLVNELEHISMPAAASTDCCFVTADIASLYTNIDTARGLLLIDEFMKEQNVPNDMRAFINDLLAFIMRHSYLIYQGRIYHQINGAAMGAAEAPIYANIFVYMLERPIVQQFTAMNKLHIYRRYLDDIFAYLDCTAVSSFTVQMNSLDPKLKFEFVSHPKEASFLDLLIYKGSRFEECRRFDLRVHQKKLNLYLYIPYLSFHSEAAKKSFIQTELMRYIRNTSNLQEYISLKKIFYQRLRDRGYPCKFLNDIFTNIYYADRKYFLADSRNILSDVTSAPPISQCLLKKMNRQRHSAAVTATSAPPLVFIIPFTPLSRCIPTRQLLLEHWEKIHIASDFTLPLPLIAYQSCPSILTDLVFRKARANRMECSNNNNNNNDNNMHREANAKQQTKLSKFFLPKNG